MTSRAERRAIAARYRRVDVTAICDTIVYDELAGKLGMRPCGQALGATFLLERGDPTPDVTFIHNPDGSHRPQLSGDSMAARARRSGQIIGESSERH